MSINLGLPFHHNKSSFHVTSMANFPNSFHPNISSFSEAELLTKQNTKSERNFKEQTNYK
jgi:hypothetical protein